MASKAEARTLFAAFANQQEILTPDELHTADVALAAWDECDYAPETLKEAFMEGFRFYRMYLFIESLYGAAI